MLKRILLVPVVLAVSMLLTSVSSITLAKPRSAPNAIDTPTRTPTPVFIGNFVWNDLDQDGLQDAGEPGLSGVTVELWNSDKTQLLDSTVTNANGNYVVVAPSSGSYRVRVILPDANDQFSPKDAPTATDTTDSDINPSGGDAGFTDVIFIAANVISNTTIDAGIIKYRPPTSTRTPTPVYIGNFVWLDLDQDGVQDVGEPGVSGITVQLWNSDKTQLLDATVTNGNGNYTVVAPSSGAYRVRVVLPGVNDQFSPKDAPNATDTTDSDINPAGPDLGFTDIINIAANVISISTIDAGISRLDTPTPTATATATWTPSASHTPTATQTPKATKTIAAATPTPTTTEFATATDLSTLVVRRLLKGGVVVKWQTATEARLAGFDVWRQGKAVYRKLNPQFIQAKHAGDAASARYRFQDKAVKHGKTYAYKLDLFYLDGHSEWSRIVKLRP